MKIIRVLALLLVCAALFACVGCAGKPAQKKPYGATINGVRIELDAKAPELLVQLGTHTSYDESPTCAYEGYDKVYGYGAFEIETYTLGGIEYVRAIHLLDDTQSTRKGISVGDTVEAVKEAYGEPSRQTSLGLTYAEGDTVLEFLVRDGKVTNINYRKVVD
ncbi:MAG: hypothetical protein IKC31_01475 [Clostridia bacterium]|nr:hypothetical protein [Clostridia bacterium]MBR2926231.1 hypothetical protein [Clostridia bacterium]